MIHLRWLQNIIFRASNVVREENPVVAISIIRWELGGKRILLIGPFCFVGCFEEPLAARDSDVQASG